MAKIETPADRYVRLLSKKRGQITSSREKSKQFLLNIGVMGGIGVVLGTAVAGSVGAITGEMIGSTLDSDEKKAYNDVYKRTKKKMKKTK